jgi:hypothetical protein
MKMIPSMEEGDKVKYRDRVYEIFQVSEDTFSSYESMITDYGRSKAEFIWDETLNMWVEK